MDLEKINKKGLFLFVALYVIGFLVTSIYLNDIGVSFVSFIQLQYVVSGALLCYPIISAFVVINFIVLFFHLSFEPYTITSTKYEIPLILWGLIRALVFFLLWALVATFVVFIPISGFIYSNRKEIFSIFSNSYFDLIFISVVFINVIIGLGFTIFDIISTKKKVIHTGNIKKITGREFDETKIATVNNGFLVFISTIWVIFFSIYLNVYSTRIFPLIPQSLAGASPKQIYLIKKKDSESINYINNKTDTLYSNPYLLLFETNDKLVLKSSIKSQQSFIIYKEGLSGIKLLTN